MWQRWHNWLDDHTYWLIHSALIHGDLHPGHILVDRVTGLLDWTEASVANPATDFALYYAIFGESALSHLLQQYQQSGGQVWPRMHDRIVELYCAYLVMIAMFVLRTGEESYIELAQMMLSTHEQQMVGLGY
ncbi:phosphotransferase [Nostoc linckia]|uniref:phosphotransferase n=1 Tax=Nostoc linckia TaxID=92942 RepID=UPI002414DCF4|nr:phosphotransferase [Nostoc linckia]